MENIVKIRIKPEKRKTEEGREFTVYKGWTKNGVIIDVKFRSEIPQAELPTEDCVVVVADDKCNKDKRKAYPTVWISEILEILPVGATIDVEANRKEMHDMFG